MVVELLRTFCERESLERESKILSVEPFPQAVYAGIEQGTVRLFLSQQCGYGRSTCIVGVSSRRPVG